MNWENTLLVLRMWEKLAIDATIGTAVILLVLTVAFAFWWLVLKGGRVL